MKVQGPNRPIPLEQVRSTQTGEVSRPDASPGHAGERVRVSDEARTLMEARAPEVPDQDRIARLKEAIVNGTFKVDTSRIAEAMLREEL